MQGTCDMNKCPEKYICIDQSSNKGIYKHYVKKDTQCSFKTMNIEVLGIFQKWISSYMLKSLLFIVVSLLGFDYIKWYSYKSS